MLTRKQLSLTVLMALFCLLMGGLALGADAGAGAAEAPAVAAPAPAAETPAAETPAATPPAAETPAAETPTTAPAAETPTTAPAAETPATEPATEPINPVSADVAKNWAEFLHYVQIGREDAARSYAQAVADAPADDRDIFRLSESRADVDVVLARGANLSNELAAVIKKIQVRISRGFDTERRDPDTIAQQIQRLEGTPRAIQLGGPRLVLIGEFALPQMVQKLRDPSSSPRLKQSIELLLPRMGKAVVPGLAAALQTDDANLQYVLCRVLGELGYPNAGPRLKELIERPGVSAGVQEAAKRALLACVGPTAFQKPLAELFYDLARKYYDRAESLLPDPRYETASVWYWTSDLGLVFKPVPRPIYCDVYTMRLARLALQYDPTFYKAVSLWIAANLDKEALLPPGAADPTREANQPAANYYALAGSAAFLQDVLAMALKDNNSPVAIGAIAALSKTAGAKNLVQPVEGGVQPLVSALAYPDRHVRFLAAAALAEALPLEDFAGQQQVLWVLNEAIRQTGKHTALLVAADDAQRNLLKDALRAADYGLVDEPDSAKAVTQMQSLGSVDVAVLTDTPGAAATIRVMRQDPLLATMPVVCATQNEDVRRLAEVDKRVVVLPAQPSAQQVAEALKQVLALNTGGPMAEDQATQWAVRAAKAVRGLGYTRNGVFDISRCLSPLALTLDDPRTPVRLAAAEALAVLPKAEAQQAIAALANNPAVEVPVRIEAYKDLSESLRWFGNQLTDEQAQAVVNVVKGLGAEEPLRVAAAQALGAMNLPSAKISSLFLDTAGKE